MAKEINNLRRTIDELLASLPERHQDVVKRRFGISQDQRETLEAIGEDYGITRERVRQIEDYALSTLKKPDNFSRIHDAVDYIEGHIEDHGHIVKEEKLLTKLAKEDVHPYLVLVLTLGEPFERILETEKFHTLWTTDRKVFEKVESLFDFITSHLAKTNLLLSEEDLFVLLRKEAETMKLRTEDYILSNYLDTVHHIGRDHEGRFGLKVWPDITPRGVRDKSYIVFKKVANPLHFKELTDLINQTNFSSAIPERQAYPQTVHNELIKDERFVLIGRGIYALTEWGYKSGVVKDVVKMVLEESERPLTRDEIVEKVLGQRQVRKNTVLLNLQDKNLFKKLEDGTYVLV